STETPSIPSLSRFGTATRTRIRKIGTTLFASSLGFENAALNVDKQVADMLIAILIQNFPETSDRYPVELKRETSQPPHYKKEPFTREIQLINHQNAVISQLLETNKELSLRVAQLERRLCRPDAELLQVNTPTIADTHVEVAETCSSKAKGRSSSKSAQAVWFEWYTKTPILWVSCNDRKYKSLTKQIVAFMKLFLPYGFKLDPSSSGYADSCFLCSRGIKCKLGSGLLKHLRHLLREGALKELN
ncbi:hypothetical protein PHMEG_0008532, partial [Phytophthora megakarya]